MMRVYNFFLLGLFLETYSCGNILAFDGFEFYVGLGKCSTEVEGDFSFNGGIEYARMALHDGPLLEDGQLLDDGEPGISNKEIDDKYIREAVLKGDSSNEAIVSKEIRDEHGSVKVKNTQDNVEVKGLLIGGGWGFNYGGRFRGDGYQLLWENLTNEEQNMLNKIYFSMMDRRFFNNSNYKNVLRDALSTMRKNFSRFNEIEINAKFREYLTSSLMRLQGMEQIKDLFKFKSAVLCKNNIRIKDSFSVRGNLFSLGFGYRFLFSKSFYVGLNVDINCINSREKWCSYSPNQEIGLLKIGIRKFDMDILNYNKIHVHKPFGVNYDSCNAHKDPKIGQVFIFNDVTVTTYPYVIGYMLEDNSIPSLVSSGELKLDITEDYNKSNVDRLSCNRLVRLNENFEIAGLSKKVVVQRAASLDLTFGKDFLNKKLLLEAFVGITDRLGSYRLIIDRLDMSEEEGPLVITDKIRGYSPSVGASLRYKVSDNLSVFMKARYVFPCKKGRNKISFGRSIFTTAGLSYRFKI